MTLPMMKLTEARKHLSEVVRDAQSENGTIITLNGRPAAVVISFDEFRRMGLLLDTADAALVAARLADDSGPYATLDEVMAETVTRPA